jgi:hypothetical protein
MYTKQQIYSRDWQILDPQGDPICVVAYESEADALLSHLNRRW